MLCILIRQKIFVIIWILFELTLSNESNIINRGGKKLNYCMTSRKANLFNGEDLPNY